MEEISVLSDLTYHTELNDTQKTGGKWNTLYEQHMFGI